MSKNLWFDMDGTIVDFYGVKGWLDYLLKEDVTPYKIAKPLVNCQALARVLNNKIKKGYTVNIVSWTSKNGTKEYNKAVEKVKNEWLKKHLKSVKFNHIDVIEYGTPKQYGRFGILFDDEEHNREEWNGEAYDVKNLLEIVKAL